MADWEFLANSVDPSIIDILIKNNFLIPTEVQVKAITPLLTNKDVNVHATTGSGKTLSFAIPVIQIVMNTSKHLKKHNVHALILAPTRELAWQIYDVFLLFTTSLNIKCMIIVGGNNTAKSDMDTFAKEGGNVVIATPGRLESIISEERNDVNFDLFISSLRFIEILILDEADKLLDMGFSKQIYTIMSFIPRQRRTGLYSATDSPEVQKLASISLRNSFSVDIKETDIDNTNSSSLPIKLQNYYMLCEFDNKFSSLVRFLEDNKNSKIILFVATTHQVDYFGCVLSKILKKHKFFLLHGKLKKKRLETYTHFKISHIGILVCSDVVARGVDIPEVDWIIQYDPPKNANLFVHRCGRTARHGNSGSSVILLTQNEVDYIKYIEFNQKVNLRDLEVPDDLVDISSKLKVLAKGDRDIYLKAQKAFVSFVNYYSQHECRTLFGFTKVPFGKIANDYGLLHLPQMEELNEDNTKDFVKTKIDHSKIKFKSKIKEKLRKKIVKQKLQSMNDASKKH